MLSDEMADNELKQALDEARTPHGTVDNVLRVHSLRPNTMKGHMVLYKSCFRAQKPFESPLLGCPIHFSELLKHLIDAEARRTLSWWIVAERLQPVGNQCLSWNKQVGSLQSPLRITNGLMIRSFKWIGPQVENLRQP